MDKESVDTEALIYLGYFKHMPIYYDNNLKKVYYTTFQKGNTKIVERITVISTLFSLPAIRVLSSLDLFRFPLLNYLILIIVTALSLCLGFVVNRKKNQDLDFYPLFISDEDFLLTLYKQEKAIRLVSFTFIASIIGLLVSLITYIVHANLISLIAYPVLLFLVYYCLSNQLWQRIRDIKAVIREADRSA